MATHRPPSNPVPSSGSTPEAEQLASISRGLSEVRELIVQETAGAVSPWHQLITVDRLMQTYNDSIENFISATRRNGDMISIADAFPILMSIMEYITIAGYWLQIASNIRKLPADAPGNREESERKSHEHRIRILERILYACGYASRLMNKIYRPAFGNTEISRPFDRFSIHMLCVQVGATVAAKHYAPRGAEVQREELENWLSKVQAVHLRPSFSERSSEEKENIFLALAIIYEALGETAKSKEVQLERRHCMRSGVDNEIRALVNLLRYSETSEEKIALIRDLLNLAELSDLGPLFSRVRTGKISLLQDSFLHIAVNADNGTETGQSLVEDCFSVYDEFSFGQHKPSGLNLITLYSDWSGQGAIWWSSEDSKKSTPFTMPPSTARDFYFNVEKSTTSSDKAFREIVKFIDATLAPLISQAVSEGVDEQRLHAIGQVGTLPILAASVAGRPLGASAKIAYRHPNPNIPSRSSSRVRGIQLLVVDRCFETQSDEVVKAYREAAAKQSIEQRVISFDSRHAHRSLCAADLAQKLQSASSALIFCHIDSEFMQASDTGIVIGPNARFTAEELAGLDLQGMQELSLIGCASGRINPFVGETTVSHAAAAAGAYEILFTLWPIRPSHGSRMAVKLLLSASEGQTLRAALADEFKQDLRFASPFAIMRPLFIHLEILVYDGLLSATPTDVTAASRGTVEQ
jgi:CHAT domain